MAASSPLPTLQVGSPPVGVHHRVVAVSLDVVDGGGVDTGGAIVGKPQVSTATMGSVISFMKVLDRLQDQQFQYTKKLEKERKRKEILDENFESSRMALRELREKTRNGVIVNEKEKVHKKRLQRLEKQLQAANIKLSIARRDNLAHKAKIDSLRKDKLLHMQIKEDMEREFKESKRKVKHAQREIVIINGKKHTTEVAIVNAKHKLIRDVSEFSQELAATKQNINSTQDVILDSIRERLQATFELAAMREMKSMKHKEETSPHKDDRSFQAEVTNMLKQMGVSSIQEVVEALQHSEEGMFAAYHEIQEKSVELEKNELANKYLEQQLREQEGQLVTLEKHNEAIRQELEQHISVIQASIARHDAEYAKHLDVLGSISDSLMNLLKNVAVDGEALDQQLLSTGLTDRNIDDYLGLVEQRIDDLIQMLNAAMHKPIQREDFLRLAQLDRKAASFRAPTLPSLADEDEDGDMAATAAQGTAEESTRVQPINIGMLKDYMQKKIQKTLNVKKAIVASAADANSKNSSRAGGSGGNRAGFDGVQVGYKSTGITGGGAVGGGSVV